MDTKRHSAVQELRKTTGYSVDQLSVISGLTEVEIANLESGQLIDEAMLSRLFAAAGVATGN